MAEIVLVHGIDQQQKTADTLEAEWVPALAGALRLGGFAEEADRLVGKSADARRDVRMAFYGSMFLKGGQQGSGDGPEFTLTQKSFAEQLALEWLQRIAMSASDLSARNSARIALVDLEAIKGESQGLKSGIRSAIASLAQVKGLGRLGVGLVERTVKQSVAQVGIYFESQEGHGQMLTAVARLIDSDTRVVIAHSLGSVIAYEALHLMGSTCSLPLFITMGSPLGVRGLIYDRVWPQPPSFPPCVVRWVNVADTNDFVSAEPDLRQAFSNGIPEHSIFENHFVDNGSSAHEACRYLSKRIVGEAVGEALKGS